MGDQVHLREESTKLQDQVKGPEEEIKRDFLNHKLIVIEEV